MTCASCAFSSKSFLETLPGVGDVAVKYANASAQIEYVPTVTDPHKLKASLRTAGYDLMIDRTEEAKNELAELHKQKSDTLKKKTIDSILLFIPQ
jgi:Cu2+-exporting ATPase